MAQYGFVPAEGNPSDRVESLAADSQGSPAAGKDTLLRLDVMQEALGDEIFSGAVAGRDPYLFAALKSLPFTLDTADAPTPSSSGSGSGPADSFAAAELALVDRLLGQVQSELDGCGTSVQADLAVLRQVCRGTAAHPPWKPPAADRR